MGVGKGGCSPRSLDRGHRDLQWIEMRIKQTQKRGERKGPNLDQEKATNKKPRRGNGTCATKKKPAKYP